MTQFLIRLFVKDYQNTDQPRVRTAYGKLAGMVGIVCNLILFGLKILIGTVSGSVSITADAVNNFSDASSSIISLLGFKLAEMPADKNHPYGHGRFEYLSAMMVAVLVLVIGVELFQSSVDKILHPQAVVFSVPLVIVLVFSIAVKLWMMLFNHKVGKKINSQSLLASAADSRNDVISTFAVLTASVVSEVTNLQLDGWIGLAVAVFILISGIGLVKETINPMLGSAPDEAEIKWIHDKLLTYPKILGMHDLIIHDYGPCRKFASVHLELAAEDDVFESHEIIDQIEQDFLREGLNLIAHYDPILTKDSEVLDIRRQVDVSVKSIDQRLSIHDLRVVCGKYRTNLVFDCVSPYEVKIEPENLKAMIGEKVKQINPSYSCIITIDNSFAPIPK